MNVLDCRKINFTRVNFYTNLFLLGVKDPKSVGIHTTLSDLGMDSMTGVEIKQALEREFEIFLSPAEIRHLTFGRYCKNQRLIRIHPL